jgi:hypothetical protein
MWHKNNAVSAYTFPIPPSPSAFERDDISSEWIVLEAVDRPGYPLPDIPGQTFQVPFRFV